jgi:hypothetical protein
MDIITVSINYIRQPRGDKDAIKFPRNLEDLRNLNAILSVYIDQHYMNVYVTFVITYI